MSDWEDTVEAVLSSKKIPRDAVLDEICTKRTKVCRRVRVTCATQQVSTGRPIREQAVLPGLRGGGHEQEASCDDQWDGDRCGRGPVTLELNEACAG